MRTLEPLAMLPVAVLAVLTLWWPQGPDQSLFDLAAERLRHGAVYYRDLWDLKQPGIYWFYQAGEWLVPGGLGARFLEILLAVVAAALVCSITAGWGLRRSVRLAAPLVVLGPYLLFSVLAGAGEIEGLMNVLLLAVLACCWPAGAGPDAPPEPAVSARPVGSPPARLPPPASALAPVRLRSGGAWFAAGLLVGTVVLLKTLYTPIPLVILAGAALAGLRGRHRETMLRLGLAVVGALVPVVLAVAYLAAHHVLGVAVTTTFSLAFQVVGQGGLQQDGGSALTQAVKNMFVVAGPLAVAGLATSRQRGLGLLCVTLAVTAVAEIVLGLPQLSTAYRWLMLAAPVGLLAVAGLEVVLGRIAALRSRQLAWAVRSIAAVAAAGLTVPLLQPALGLLSARHQTWGLGAVARITRGEDFDPVTYPVASASLVAGRIPADSRVYVLGDARIQVLLGTPLSVPVAGLSMHLMPASVWAELTTELTRSRPDFIYVGSWNDATVTRTGAGQAVRQLLATHYTRIASSPMGSWYRTGDPGPALAPGYQPFVAAG